MHLHKGAHYIKGVRLLLPCQALLVPTQVRLQYWWSQWFYQNKLCLKNKAFKKTSQNASETVSPTQTSSILMYYLPPTNKPLFHSL